MRQNGRKRLLFIGLDAVPSDLIFGKLLSELPTIRSLRDRGIYGTLRSCDPPITIPAWTVMMSCRQPGELGIYGFRHRKGNSYSEAWIANSTSIRHDRVWDFIGRNGRKSIIIGVPPAYPPFEVNGKMISCFLTPTNASQYCYPSEMRNLIEGIVDKYVFDVVFRTEDRDQILNQLYDMTEKRFKVIENLISKKEWDFFMSMEIGTDRLHHAFWKFYDPKHPKYIPGNKYENVIPEYYKYIDTKIGELLKIVDHDTAIIIASDHGTKAMKGAFCINEWLIKEGYLVLKNYPNKVSDLDRVEVDWAKTKAWGWGGYYARIFFNIKEREPNGIVDKTDFNDFRTEISRKLQEIKNDQGQEMNTKVFQPSEIYDEVVGDKPDLMVYFDDLDWRSAGTVGHKQLYLSENDTGPDDSVHSMDGFYILYDPSQATHGVRKDASIYDIAPTILNIMNVGIPQYMKGKTIAPINS